VPVSLMVFLERCLVPIQLLLISCPFVIWFPWFPCTDCYKREAGSKPPDAILADFHNRRCMCLAKTWWLQPAFSPNAAVHCTPWYQGIIVWFRTQVGVWVLVPAGPLRMWLWVRWQPVQLLLEDMLLWRCLNTALMRDSF